MSNILTFPLGGMEGVLSGIGEELNELGGSRLTRLAAVGTKGDAAITVESTFNWPTAGIIYINGRRYTYAGTTALPDTFTGLQEIRNGVATASAGLAEDLRNETAVADGTETFSGIENAKRMLFISTAEGEFLDVIGQNYGRPRPPGIPDDDYRSIISSLAFGPLGTIFAIELLLNAILGVGNFTIFEDLVNNPNEVFIIFDVGVGLTPEGAAYFNEREILTSSSTTTVDITHEAAQQLRDNVLSVFLAPDVHLADFDQLPSANPTTPWVYGGSNVEGTSVTLTAGVASFVDASGALDGPFYTRPLASEAESDVTVSLQAMTAVASSTDDGINFRIEDGDKAYGIGWDGSDVFLNDHVGGSRIGPDIAHGNTAHTYRLEKDAALGEVRLFQDEILVSTAALSVFSNTAVRTVSFGAYAVGGTSSASWADVIVRVVDREHNYWNQVGIGDGTSAAGSPARISSTGSLFLAANDVGRFIRVSGSTVAHGRGNGAYTTTAAAVGEVDVTGVQHYAVDEAEPLDVIDVDRVRIPANNWDPFTAEDAGIQATLTTGTVPANNAILWTSRYGGADGDDISVEIILGAFLDVAVTVVDDGGGFDEDIEVRLNTAIHDTNDVLAAVQANPTADALVIVASAVGSDGTGAPTALASTNLAGGEDGKFLVLSASALLVPNDGTYPISTLIDSRTVLLGTHRAPADPQTLGVFSLQPEVGINWRKDPNFPTDAGFDWEIAAAGLLSGAGNKTLTLRRALPFSPISVLVTYTTVLSAQILDNEFVSNDGVQFWPFYLADPLAFLRDLIDEITAAGVIPQFPPVI